MPINKKSNIIPTEITLCPSLMEVIYISRIGKGQGYKQTGDDT